jgi:hypothetical protein
MVETIIRRFLVIQYRFDTFYFQERLLDRGLSRRSSAAICKFYEIIAFAWINWAIKSLIYFLCLIKKDYGIPKDKKRAYPGELPFTPSKFHSRDD